MSHFRLDKTLVEGADARYVSTGHLLDMEQGTLMAIPFDVERLEPAGTPIPLLDRVMQAMVLRRGVRHHCRAIAAGGGERLFTGRARQ